MKVFLTGATGFVGSHVVDELLSHGHTVSGLARSDASAATLARKGVEVVRGDISSLDALKAAASSAGAVAHLAFDHDFSRIEEICKADTKAINAIGEALEGSGKPFIVTSGAFSYDRSAAKGGLIDEDTPLQNQWPRTVSDRAALALTSKGLKPMVLRLPATVHGVGDPNFIPIIAKSFQQAGTALYVEGAAWPAVQVRDAAILYRILLENPHAGYVANGVGEFAVSLKDVAEVISKRLSLPLKEATPDEIAQAVPIIGGFLSEYLAVSSTKTQAETGWTPKNVSLVQDLANPAYAL